MSRNWSHRHNVAQHSLARQMLPIPYSFHMGLCLSRQSKPTTSLDFALPCSREGTGWASKHAPASLWSPSSGWLQDGTLFTLCEMRQATTIPHLRGHCAPHGPLSEIEASFHPRLFPILPNALVPRLTDGVLSMRTTSMSGCL